LPPALAGGKQTCFKKALAKLKHLAKALYSQLLKPPAKAGGN